MYVCHLVVDLSSVVCCINGLIAPVDRNDAVENSCISQITLWHWYKTTTTRRYRGNFVGNNSHGNIIVPSPINEVSSHSSPSYITLVSWYGCHRVFAVNFILLLFFCCYFVLSGKNFYIVYYPANIFFVWLTQIGRRFALHIVLYIGYLL